MSTLKWTGWAGVCCLGTVTFLRAVASEKDRIDRSFERRIDALEKAARRGEFPPEPARRAARAPEAVDGDAGGRDRQFISRQ